MDQDTHSTITHKEWRIKHGRMRQTTEHLFLNPDTNAPIAGLLFTHEIDQGSPIPRLQIRIIARAGKTGEIDAHLMQKKTWSVGDIPNAVTEYLRTQDMNDPATLALFPNPMKLQSLGQPSQLETTKGLMEIIAQTDLVSAQVDVRRAMFDAIKSAFVSMRTDSPTSAAR